MKKVAWSAMVAADSAAATRIAVRALDRMWRQVTKQEPPPTPRWMEFLVGKTTKAAIPS